MERAMRGGGCTASDHKIKARRGLEEVSSIQPGLPAVA